MTSAEPGAVVLLDDGDVAAVIPRLPSGVGLRDVVQSVASSPMWDGIGGVVLAGREAAPAVLAAVGDAVNDSRVQALRASLAVSLRSIRYVGYEQAERDVEALATRLHDRMGEKHLRTSSFAAIPRGGHIVLGMLSYALDLRPDQLTTPDPSAPLVIVDDCALSGARLLESLERVPHNDVTFAALYAHPDLRDAAERQPRVRACVSAHDLTDHAPEVYGDRYAGWRRRWAGRTERLWIGIPDHVCFAWSEPEMTLWDDATQTTTPGWRLLPNARRHAGPDAPGLDVQWLTEDSGWANTSRPVVVAEINDAVVVCDPTNGDATRLTGPAAAAARWMNRDADTERVVTGLSADLGIERDFARALVDRVTSALRTQGLAPSLTE